jgi:hypothetical protein
MHGSNYLVVSVSIFRYYGAKDQAARYSQLERSFPFVRANEFHSSRFSTAGRNLQFDMHVLDISSSRLSLCRQVFIGLHDLELS